MVAPPRVVAASLVALTCAPACGGAPEVAVCVRLAEPDPLAPELGIENLVFRGTPLEGPPVVRFFDPGAERLALGTLDFGTWLFSLEAQDAGGAVLARGRTPLVGIRDEDVEVPCLYFARVGTFGPAEGVPFGTARFAWSAAESRTALVATTNGIARYDHTTGAWDTDTIEPLRVGATAVWARLPAGRAVAIDPVAAVAWIPGTGEPRALAGAGDLHGVAVSAIGLARVLVVGGAPTADGAPSGAVPVRLVDLDTGEATPVEVDGAIAVRDSRIEPLGNGRVVVVGGNEGTPAAPVPSGRVLVIDPQDGVVAEGELDVPRWDAAVAVVADNVLVFGGRTGAATATSSIEQFQLAGGTLVRRGSPGTLLGPRAGAAALVTAGDAVIVVGGEGEVSSRAERFLFTSIDTQELTHGPEVELPAPTATSLHDGTFLVVGGMDAVVYAP